MHILNADVTTRVLENCFHLIKKMTFAVFMQINETNNNVLIIMQLEAWFLRQLEKQIVTC